MNASRRATPKPLVLALSAACLVPALAGCGGGGGAQSAGPVPTVPPASKRVGFVGLPPEGATPSTPKSGELVLLWFGDAPAKIVWTNRDWGRSRAWLYADGRLIRWREGDFPYGANHISTGYVEQRLTPDGVELLRSEIDATGVFGHDPPSVSRGLGHSAIQVRDGDRLLSPGGPVSARGWRKLAALLADPGSWLPASAWEDRELRAYVPSRYAVCYGWAGHSTDVLTLLPAPAKDLLRARDRKRMEGFNGAGYCSNVTTEEGRALAEALRDGGLKRAEPAGETLAYGLEPGSFADTASIWFEPYLPHGETVCTPCG